MRSKPARVATERRCFRDFASDMSQSEVIQQWAPRRDASVTIIGRQESELDLP